MKIRNEMYFVFGDFYFWAVAGRERLNDVVLCWGRQIRVRDRNRRD
jgi:hypothetical protein